MGEPVRIDGTATRLGELDAELADVRASLTAAAAEPPTARSLRPGSDAAPDTTELAIAQRALAVATGFAETAEALADTAARTYRALRLVMIATVPAIFLAVLLVWAGERDHESLPTLSHYYYTPAGAVFIGALCVAAAALLALSGRGAERVLLDVAAFFAPLIALVPTPLTPASAAELGFRCPSEADCIPAPFDRYVDVSVAVWFAAVLAAVAFAAVLAVTALRRGQRVDGSVWATIGVTLALLVAYTAARHWHPDWFMSMAHVVSASAFLLLLASVAFIEGRRPPYRTPAQVMTGQPASAWQRVLSRVTLVIAVLMFAVLVPVALIFVGWLDPAQTRFPTMVLWIEVAALSLFCAFWIIQTARKWNDPDA